MHRDPSVRTDDIHGGYGGGCLPGRESDPGRGVDSRNVQEPKNMKRAPRL